MKRGGIVLAYFFLLRRSELFAADGMVYQFALRGSDIVFADEHGVASSEARASQVGINLRAAKNDQGGRGAIRFLQATGDPLICPVRAARHVVEARRILGVATEAPLMATSGDSMVTSSTVVNTLREAAQDIGTDAAAISTHSLRMGGASALLNAGIDSLHIKKLGRWASNAFERYPSLGDQDTAALSAAMVHSSAPGAQRRNAHALGAPPHRTRLPF